MIPLHHTDTLLFVFMATVVVAIAVVVGVIVIDTVDETFTEPNTMCEKQLGANWTATEYSNQTDPTELDNGSIRLASCEAPNGTTTPIIVRGMV